MMDYSELTDDEIALLVGKRSGLCGFESEYGFDPCNDPSDAWPIILENEITLYAPRHLTQKTFWGAQHYIVNTPKIVKDKNPLRAAMIVYLMMGGDDA